MTAPKLNDPHLGPLPTLIFGSRWLQLPLYLGLIVAQGVYVVLFLKELCAVTPVSAAASPMLCQPWPRASASSGRGAGRGMRGSYRADGRQRRNISVLDTTLTLENAIAAPASTGSSRPAIASGMPMTL